MRSRLLIALAAAIVLGCTTTATPPPPAEEDTSGDLLVQADAKLVAEDYAGAIAAYSEFVAAMGGHPQAARARATQAALERLVATRTVIARAQQNTEAARRELTERQAEADRLKAEVAKLRADLERLRNIDLPPSRQK